MKGRDIEIPAFLYFSFRKKNYLCPCKKKSSFLTSAHSLPSLSRAVSGNSIFTARSTLSIIFLSSTARIKGIILSGSPYSVRQDDAPNFDFQKFHTKLPILGVCYGAQHIAHNNGGEVMKSSTREYGRANLQYIEQGK